MPEISFTLFLDTRADHHSGRLDNCGTKTVEGHQQIIPWIRDFIGQKLLLQMNEVHIRTSYDQNLDTVFESSTESFQERFHGSGPFAIYVFTMAGLHYYQPIKFRIPEAGFDVDHIFARRRLLKHLFEHLSIAVKTPTSLLEFKNDTQPLCGETNTLEDLRGFQHTRIDHPVVITVIRKKEVVLRVQGTESSLQTVLCAPNPSSVCGVLEEAATRYGHCLEAYDVKLNFRPFEIEDNRTLTIGQLAPRRQNLHPIITMTLLTPAQLEAQLAKSKIADQCRKRTLAMTEQEQRVAVAKEDEERMTHAAVVDHLQTSLKRALKREKLANRDNHRNTTRLKMQCKSYAVEVSQSEAKCRRLEQEIQKAASLATAAEPVASEAEPVAAPVVKVKHMETPLSYFCPISYDIMTDPVMLVQTGRTYEREKIEEWLMRKNTDPMTNEHLNNNTLVPNRTLKQAIAEWSERSN
jgi:hypothetical protein